MPGPALGRTQPNLPGWCMFVHDPGAVIAVDGQDAALQLGIGMGADALLEGGEQAVGKAFKG